MDCDPARVEDRGWILRWKPGIPCGPKPTRRAKKHGDCDTDRRRKPILSVPSVESVVLVFRVCRGSSVVFQHACGRPIPARFTALKVAVATLRRGACNFAFSAARNSTFSIF